MRLNLPEPLPYWGYNPFDEITIPSREGILTVFLHAVTGENTFSGIITYSDDLLRQKGLKADVLVHGEFFDDYVLIHRSDGLP